jgi:adenine-specific DNA glycosylase
MSSMRGARKWAIGWSRLVPPRRDWMMSLMELGSAMERHEELRCKTCVRHCHCTVNTYNQHSQVGGITYIWWQRKLLEPLAANIHLLRRKHL